jgi:hypothetical protein
MDRYGSYSRLRFTVTLLILVMAVGQACTPEQTNINVLQGISVEPTQTLALDTPLKFILNGAGSCTTIDIDWGDGNIEQTYTYFGGPVDLSGSDPNAVSSRTLTHTFTGWGGGKTVTVEGKIGCIGKVNVRFNVPPFEKTIGWDTAAAAGTTGVCQTPAPSLPGMIPRMLVHVTATTVVYPYINFGCALNGCVYDADGKPGSVADSRFPFPGKREYSVVYRIGTQEEQGGTNTQFTTTASGPLEFCLNDGDSNLTNNAGGFNIKLSVDQLGP